MVDVDVTTPDGQQYTVPEDKLEEAKAKYNAVPVVNSAPTAETLPNVQDQVKAEDVNVDGTYNVVRDGKQYTVPVDKLPEAIQQYGAKLLSQHKVENEHAARVNYWVNDLKNRSADTTSGHGDTFLRGFADEMLAGGAQKAEDWLASKLFNIQQTPEQQKENEAYAEAIRKVNDEQSTAHGVGAVAGFLGQTYLGSKMAGAAGKLVNPAIEGALKASPYAAAAAKEAIAGAVTVSPQAMAQAVIDQDPKAATESILIGLGTGGILGVGLKGASNYFAKAERATAAAEREAQIAQHSVHLDVPDNIKAPAAEDAIDIKKSVINPDAGINAGPSGNTADSLPLSLGKQARAGGKFVAGKEVSATEGSLTPGWIAPHSESVFDFGGGKTSINSEAFHEPNHVPESESVFNIKTQAPDGIESLNGGEKTLLDKLGLTRGMRHIIGEPEDQNRILRVLAKHFGGGDVDAGQRAMLKMSREDLAIAVKKLTEENGPKIGQIRSELDKAIAVDPTLRIPIIPIAEKIEALKAGLVSNEEKNVVDQATKFLGDKMEHPENAFVDFTEADKIKHYFQKLAKFDKNSSAVTDPIKHQIAGIVREQIDAGAERIATSLKATNPKIIEQWSDYKALYGVGKSLDKAASGILDAPITHEYIPGGHGALGAGFLGHIIGSAIGLPVVGPLIGMVGAKLAKNYLREGGIAKAAYWLGGRIQDPAIHSYIAVDAIHSMQKRVDEIPRFVKSLAEAYAARPSRPMALPALNSIKEVLGEEANGLSKEQQFTRLSEKINAMKANPAAMQKHISETVEGLANHHVQLAQDLSVAMMNKLEYLYTILPKNPNQPMPFRHDVEWKPSAIQINTFQKQLAVANDPFHVLEELKAGTLTAPQVATLSVLNPDLLQKMRGELIKISMEKNVKLDYQQRLTMGILLGEKIDAGLMSLPPIQGPSGAPAGHGAPKPGKKMSLKQDKLPDYRLTFQKAMDK